MRVVSKCEEVVEVLYLQDNAFTSDGLGPAGGGGGAEGRDAKAAGDMRQSQQGRALRQAQEGVQEAGDRAVGIDEGTVVR